MTAFLNKSNSSSCSTTYDDLLFNILKESARSNSTELIEYFNEFNSSQELICDYFKMIAIADSTTLMESLNENTNDDNNIIEDDGRISLAYENLRNIPRKIAENYANDIRFLDLSFNYFKNISFLSYFKKLNTLILDRNIDLDEKTFPYLGNLEILWLNNCNIINISKWIYRIQLQCPNLKHLSLMGNPGAKTLFNGATSIEENEFRTFIMDIIPNLIYLDGISVDKKIDDSIITAKPKQLQNSALKYNDDQSPRTKFFKKNAKKDFTSSIRDLFRFNVRHRKNYQSSSTS